MLIFVLCARTIVSRADFYIFRHAQCKNNAASFRLPPSFPIPKASPRRALPLLGEVPSAHTGERGLRTQTRSRPDKTGRSADISFSHRQSLGTGTLSALAALGHLSRRERQGMLPPCLFAFSSSPLVCGLIFFRAKPLTFRAALPILSGWAAHAARLSNDSQEHCFIWITTF